MKERRASGRSGDPADISEVQEKLAALRRARELAGLGEDDAAALLEAAARRGVLDGSSADWREILKHRTELPCKVTRVEQALAHAERWVGMTPASALSYASWIVANERAWRSTDGRLGPEREGEADAPAFSARGSASSLPAPQLTALGWELVRGASRAAVGATELAPEASGALRAAEPQWAEWAAVRQPPPAGRAAGDTAPSLRESLLKAAARGESAAELLAGAEPAAGAEALRALRETSVPGRSAPALRLLTQASGGEVERALARDSQGQGLAGSLAERLAPHVGGGATAAARLHTDAAADDIAAAHHARAVTLGERIYFARGEFSPGTLAGDELLAHELTHVAQGQAGHLGRAAAKGLDSGNTLDPAEAEADLRARLAVLELHAPTAAPPAVAHASGQPTTDGERAAKLAAQRQRFTAAEREVLPDAPVPNAPTARPQQPQVHQPPPLTPVAAAGPGDNAYNTVFDAPPSKQALEKWAGAGAAASKEATADQAKFEANLKPLPVLLDGSEPKLKAPEHASGTTPKAAPSAGSTPPAAKAAPTPPPPTVTTASTAAEKMNPSATPEQIKADGKKVIQNLPTSSPDVKTTPGPAPVTELAEKADPVRTAGEQHHAMTESVKAFEEAKKKIIAGPGAAQVQPAKLDEKLQVPKAAPTGAMPELPQVEGMEKFKKWNLPGNVQASFDELAKPKMDASLAEAKAKMTQAEVKRDDDRAKAVDDAHDKVKKAHEDADKKQQSKVAESRTQIANHQATTLAKHEKEIKKLDQQSDDKKKGALAKVNDRVSQDQAKVEADYAEAQKKAEEKKKKGEEEAARKKKEAEDKAKDDSWWGSITSAICDAISAIADEIDKALEAIGKAIGEIIDAVKNAACQLIDAARDFVCQALEEFGNWLKSAVTALLGTVFPELAAELNRLIDSAVSAAKDAVNAIADGLKSAVTALCDGLKAAVDGIIAAYRTAVQAAATFAKAVVTGDWSLVAKMVLEGVLKLLGIDPAAFYALIGKAMDSIDKIIENPGAFVGHLIDAVKLGFQQFGGNFLNHLKNGVVQWLFGTFAEAGIRMPARFDVAGIFDLVMQILGITWPRMRGKVEKIIGPKNTERLEFVSQYVEALMTGGFAGLWEKVQQDLSGLWDMVIGGVQSWLVEKLVQQAIVKIATMWNPAGAIIQLIQTAWNVYQWLRENAQRIFGLVQAVVDSISNIVAGNIGGAANYIEQSLAKLVPIAISLFANLLGLGGIADKIKSIIEKIQTKVDQAIDKLINRVMGMFKGKGKGDGKDDKDAKGDGKDKPDENKEVGAKIKFQVGSETHTQYIDKGVPMVASTPTGVKAKIEEWRPRIRELAADQQQKAGKLLSKAVAIEKNVASLAAEAKADKAKESALETKQRELADVLAQVWEIMAPELDPSKSFAEQDPKATLKSPQYAQFKSRFLALAKDLDMPAGDAKAQEIWLHMVTTLQKTDAAYKAAPTVAGSPRKDLSADAFQKIMVEFEPITAALAPYMEKYAKGKKSWAFWSGRPAVEVAKKHSEVCLEKSALGGLFDGININGGWDIQMWASLSKAYASHAAGAVGHAKYRGFVGMGSSAEQSIFNKIEQPQFASMLGEKKQVTVHVDWFAAAGDPKTSMAQPDWRFTAGGLDGVYATGDRAAMVDKAETENKRRLDLFKDKGIDEGPGGADGKTEGLDEGLHDPIEAAGSMEGTPHKLVVTAKDVTLHSVPAPLATKVGTAEKNIKDAVAALPAGGTQADADKLLAQIKKDYQAIKDKIAKIPVGKTDALPAGYEKKKGATANSNLTQLAKDLMQLSESIMSAINAYGAKFKVHELDEPIKDRYPTPDVGVHTVAPSAKNAKIVPPDNLPRESHHVPNNELYQTLLGELAAAGKAISSKKNNFGFQKKSGFRMLGEAMLATHAELEAKHGGAGKGLSAILVHRITHQNINQNVGTAVHSKGMATLIDKAIQQEEDALGVQYERIATSKGISVKPTSSEWQPYVDKCKQRAETAKTDAEKQQAAKDLTTVKAVQDEIKVVSQQENDALQRIGEAQIRPTMRQSFESGLGHTFNAIKTALELSKVDGPDGEKTAALGSLRDLAKQVWTPLVEAKFTIPEAELSFQEVAAPTAGAQGEKKDEKDKPVVEHFEMNGESHTLTIERTERGTRIIMASTPGELLDKIDTALEACKTELEALTQEKKGKKGAEAETIGTSMTRIKNIRDALRVRKSKYKDKVGATLDVEAAKKLAIEIAQDLIVVGRQYDIRSIGDVDMDLRSKQALNMPGHKHDQFIYGILTELGSEVVESGKTALGQAAQPDDSAAKTFERLLASARAGYSAAIHSAEHTFSFGGYTFVVEPQGMSKGGSANYIFPTSKAMHPDRYSMYGYPGFKWSVDQLRGYANALINKQTLGEDEVTMFLAAMIAEPERNVVAEVTNALVLGPSTPGGAQAFKANGGEMPMTTGGTIKDPHDSSLDDVRKGSAKSSGAVTDQEVEMAKTYYKKSTGQDLVDVIESKGANESTRTHVKGVLRAQFHKP